MANQLDRRSRLHELENQARDHYDQAARSLWSVGQCLLEVRNEELWREDGHGTFDAWLASDRLPWSRGSGYKAMRIAEHFNGDMAGRFGTEKLDAAVSYLNATAKEERPGDLLALKVQLRGEDGKWKIVPFIDASAAQIRQAVHNLGVRRRNTRLPAQLHDRVTRFNGALPTVSAAFETTRVALKRRRDGTLMLRMDGVPVDDLELFVVALRAHLLAE